MPQDEKERGISRAPALGQIILERAAKSPLVEMEAIEGLAREKNIALKPAETRRNLVTHGVPLNHLVGKEFQVGDVRLVGIRLCEPCHYLGEMTTKGVLVGLIHRGGLRANVLTRGLIRVGDSVTEVVKTEESHGTDCEQQSRHRAGRSAVAFRKQARSSFGTENSAMPQSKQ